MADITMKEMLTEQFDAIASRAVELKRLVDSAKTTIKKEYFTKKLLKVNRKAYALMLELAILEAKTNPEFVDSLDADIKTKSLTHA